MAVIKLDYIPGSYEAITDEPLDDTPVLNTWYHFTIDGWSHAMSDIVLKQGGSVVPTSAYELTIDEKYKAREVSESGKTLYGLWRIVDGTYDAIATTISGNNFASYVSNENVQAQIDAIPTPTQSDWAETNTADVTYIKNKPIPLTSLFIGNKTSSQSLANNAHTIITWNELTDANSEFISTTFTAKTTGVFSLSANIAVTKATSSTNHGIVVFFYLNGSPIAKNEFSSVDWTSYGLTLSTVVPLSIGDKIYFDIYTSGTLTATAAYAQARCSIIQIR